MKSLFTLLVILGSGFTLSMLFAQTDQKARDKFILKTLKAKKIEWIDNGYMAKIQFKKSKKWGVFMLDVYIEDKIVEKEAIIPAQFDSIAWFERGSIIPVSLVKNNGKYGLLQNPDEIGSEEAVEKAACIYDEIKIVQENDVTYCLFREGAKWGLVDWFTGMIVVDPIFDDARKVPLTSIPDWMEDIFRFIKKKMAADLILMDEGNGDGVYKARDKNTQKWGMFQCIDTTKIDTLIPAVYDSVANFPWNGSYTAVFNDGKIGFYLSKWSYGELAKQTIECKYDDYKRFRNKGTKYLAVKRDGYWGWVNWLTGKEQSDFKALTTDDLPFPQYDQTY